MDFSSLITLVAVETSVNQSVKSNSCMRVRSEGVLPPLMSRKMANYYLSIFDLTAVLDFELQQLEEAFISLPIQL